MILYRDWSEPSPKTFFQVVQELYNCNHYDALKIIHRDMLEGKNEKPIYDYNKEIEKLKEKKGKKHIRISRGNWNKEQIDYLKSYHLDSKTCNRFNIHPVDTVFLEGRIHYKYNPYDPALAYYFGDNNGEERWKIYFFKRKNSFRFLGNTNRINGWIQLPQTHKYIVLTKSLKDVACLSLFDIPAIAMQNETTLPYDYIIEELKTRFDHIYSLYDYDKTGLYLSKQLQELYGIKPFFFKNIPDVKDFSDYLKKNGKQKTLRLINYVLVKENLDSH